MRLELSGYSSGFSAVHRRALFFSIFSLARRRICGQIGLNTGSYDP
jgi:hypothetical protein